MCSFGSAKAPGLQFGDPKKYEAAYRVRKAISQQWSASLIINGRSFIRPLSGFEHKGPFGK
jgi:hypothetical protein